ncbi:MAG: hypothetical protein LBD25_03085 [Coriobacteriales bacterium]|nr:hypothetical protein [Coriobacteriales bacterium]
MLLVCICLALWPTPAALAATAAKNDDAHFDTRSDVRSDLRLAASADTSTTALDSLTVLYVPGLQWHHVNSADMPALFSLAQRSGVGNLAVVNTAPEVLFDHVATVTSLTLEGALGDESQAARIDEQIAQHLDALPAGAALLLVGTLTADSLQASGTAEAERYYPLLPLIVLGGGIQAGCLTSSSTQRVGLVAGSDLQEFAEAIGGARTTEGAPANTDTAPGAHKGAAALDSHPAPWLLGAGDADGLLAFLQHNIDVCESVHATKEVMDLFFLCMFILVFAFAFVLLLLEINVPPKRTRLLVPASRILLLVALSYPVSTFLMFLVPPPLYPVTDTPAGMVATCAAWMVVVFFSSLLIGARKHWVYALFFLYLLTFACVLGDLLTGGPLSLTGYLNYQVDQGVRYYGIGNEGSALLFGSWVTFSGHLANRFPKLRFIPAFRRWGFLAASLVIVTICALPMLGASFGVLIWGTMGVLVAWWLLNERRIKLRYLFAVLLFTCALAVGILYADVTLNPNTHMDHLGPSLASGIVPLATELFRDVLAYSWVTITYSPVLTVAFILLLLWLLVLAAVKPGTYTEFWAKNRGLRAAFAAGLVIVLIMGAIEDSGIFMPSIYLAFLLASLIWVICDMHTWRSNYTMQSGTHVTGRELLRMALELETYRTHTIPAEAVPDALSAPLSPPADTPDGASTDEAAEKDA